MAEETPSQQLSLKHMTWPPLYPNSPPPQSTGTDSEEYELVPTKNPAYGSVPSLQELPLGEEVYEVIL